jgi:hypothetical protein
MFASYAVYRKPDSAFYKFHPEVSATTFGHKERENKRLISLPKVPL